MKDVFFFQKWNKKEDRRSYHGQWCRTENTVWPWWWIINCLTGVRVVYENYERTVDYCIFSAISHGFPSMLLLGVGCKQAKADYNSAVIYVFPFVGKFSLKNSPCVKCGQDRQRPRPTAHCIKSYTSLLRLIAIALSPLNISFISFVAIFIRCQDKLIPMLA